MRDADAPAATSAAAWREHTFDVTLERLVGVTLEREAPEAHEPEHGGVYLAYLFPGETELLYTQVVPYSSEGVHFRGTAAHSVWLPEEPPGDDGAVRGWVEALRTWAGNQVRFCRYRFLRYRRLKIQGLGRVGDRSTVPLLLKLYGFAKAKVAY